MRKNLQGGGGVIEINGKGSFLQIVELGLVKEVFCFKVGFL